MGEYYKQRKVKLFAGILYTDYNLYKKALKLLENKFGKIDFISSSIDFSIYSNYYNSEMGDNIKRVFISFERLILPYKLAKIKELTNKIENKLKINRKRKVNIDPGLITFHNLILATTKNYSHRIALNKRIYGEVTLIFKNKNYYPLDWTYPDYKDPENIKIFKKIREIYKLQLKNKN